MKLLRDMGLKPKDLIAAAAKEGIKLSPKRASEIISGVAYIKPAEMEILAKLLNKSVDDLYVEIGSVLEVICPLLSAGGKQFVVCCRQKCAWWDWEMQWCTVKNYSANPAEREGGK